MSKLRAKRLPKRTKLRQKDFSKPFWMSCPIAQCPRCGTMHAMEMLVLSTRTYELSVSTATKPDTTTASVKAKRLTTSPTETRGTNESNP